jgi:hypothetical protein
MEHLKLQRSAVPIFQEKKNENCPELQKLQM